MKYAWLGATLVAGLIAASACSGDETTPTTATTGAGGSGGGDTCGFMMSGGYGGFGDVCMDEASDGACVTCTRGNCCDELQACETDEQCSCLMACFLEGCDPVGCLLTCTNDGNEQQTAETQALTQCATGCDACLE